MMFGVYVINMTKDLVKREHMERACSSRLAEYEFVEAVEGARLSAIEIQGIYSEQSAIAEVGRPLSSGEIGCFLSHKKLYSKLLSSDLAAAVVLEDDVALADDIQAVVNEVMTMPSWDIIFLGHHGRSSRSSKTLVSFWGQKRIGGGRRLARPCEKVMGTYGYIISRRGALKMLSKASGIQKPIDHLTGDYRSLDIYCVIDPVVMIDDVMSEEHHSMHERAQLKTMKKLHAASNKRSVVVRAAGALARIWHAFINVVRVFWPC